MTTIALPETHTPGARLLNVVKLHFANPWMSITFPWIILGVIFAANLAIWALIFLNTPESEHADIAQGFQWSGASLYIFVYMMVVAVQAINVTFQFALGYGVTRRDYYIGTALHFVLLAAMYAIGLTILSVVEEATNGWGLGGRMFTAAYFGDGPWFERLFIYFTLLIFFFFVGAAAAAVFVRWKSFGLTTFFIVLGLLLIAVGFVISVTDSWGAVGQFLETAGWVGTYAWSLVISAIAAIAGYLILRRATPKS